MIDGDLSDAKTELVRKHRDEAVQVSVDADTVQKLGAERLETTVHVVQVKAGNESRHTVVDPREHPARKRILPIALPPRDEVIAFVELGEQVRDLSRIVLKVGVHRDDHRSTDDVEPCAERGGLAEVPAEPYDSHVGV